MEDKKINKPKSPSQKVKKSFLGTSRAKLLFALMISFVVAMVSGVAIVFGVKNQKGLDNANKVQITRYENELPLEIVDGEIRSYNGVNNGGAVLEIPSQVYIDSNGKVFASEEKYNQYLLELEQQKIDNENNQNNDINQNENQSIDQNIDNQNDINTNQDDENIQVKNTQAIQGGGYVEITSIAQGAFKDVKFFCLTIDMENIARVGESAFENAENVYLTNNQNGYVIADYAFKNSTMLLEDGMLYAKPNGSSASIGNEAFLGVKAFDYELAKSQSNNQIALKAAATQISSATLVASETSGIIKLGSSSIGGVSNINFTNFYGTVYFADEMAKNNTTLISLTLPKGASYIGSNAFNGCTNLETVNTQGNIVQLNSSAFANCSLITSINLKFTSLKTIKNSTFANCFSLSNVNLPLKTQTLCQYSFYNTGMSGISFPNTLTTIEEYAFANCKYLTSVSIPKSVMSIEKHVFGNCVNLNSVSISNENENISSDAFYGCTSLKEVLSLENSGYMFAGFSYLPDGYTGVEYIVSTGTQYIDTGITCSNNTKVEMKVLPCDSYDEYDIFGTRSTGGSPDFGIHTIFNCWSFGYKSNSWIDYIESTTSNNVRTIIVDNNKYYIDGVLKYTATATTFAAVGTALLMHQRNFSGKGLNGRLYYCKIWNNNVLVRNFIPCKNSNNIYGFWDTVSNQFFTNVGTGTLSGGPVQEKIVSSNQLGNINENSYSVFSAGYQQVEYITSTGTQYIDTGITCSNNTKVEIKVLPCDSNSEYDFFGTRTSSNKPEFGLHTIQKCYSFGYKSNSWIDYIESTSSNKERTIYVDNNKYYIDGVLMHTATATTFTAESTALLLQQRNWSGNGLNGRLYYCKIWSGDTLVRNFVPCKNSSDEYGFWDTVSNQFFANIGTGTLSGGPAIGYYVLPENYSQVDYIASTGTQYIDTGITCSNNTKVEIKVLPCDSYNEYDIFGTRTTSNSGDFGIHTIMNCWSFGYRNNSWIDYIESTSSNQVRVVCVDNNKYYLDGVLKYTATATTFTAVGTAYLMKQRNQNISNSTIKGLDGKLYYCKIWNSGTLVRDFIPCINPSGEYGLWDTVSNQFFGNIGTGSLTGGKLKDFSKELNDIDMANQKLYPRFVQGYQQVEYIESTGTQYIDTGYKHSTGSTVFDFEASITSLSSYNYGTFFGSRSSYNNANAYYVGIRSNGQTYACIGANHVDPLGWNVTLNTKYHLVTDPSQGVFVDGTLYSVPYQQSVITEYNTYIFKGNYQEGYNEPLVGRIYNFKIYDNGTLVRNFIPCYNTTTGVIGLYDSVTNTFFTNSGTGTFTKGPNV